MVLLRPALEAAVAVARSGADADPPVPAPSALRPFLSFRRLSGRALERAQRVLEDDEGFRARVRDAVDPDDVGRAGWLFLDRPEGWEDELGELVGAAAREAEEADSAEEVARLRRELDRMRADRDEAREERDALLRSDVVARAEAEGARAELDAAEARLRELEAERDEARDERGRAVRDLKALEVRAAARLDELRRAQEDLAAARREVASLEEAVEGDEAGAAVGDPEASVEADAPGTAAGGVPGPGAQGAIDRGAIASLVASAAEAADALATALAGAAALVAAGAVDEPGTPGAQTSVGADREAASAPARAPWEPAEEAVGRRPAGREPVPLPVGVFDDSPEAALHWLRHPGMALAVDGYNVSLAGWPTLALGAQRRRLLDALEALAARTGCSVVVVFDGADLGGGGPSGSRPRGVQVRFTAPEVEADDDLLALLDALPADQAVTVASSDRRVAEGARARGASTLSSAQLLAVLDA